MAASWARIFRSPYACHLTLADRLQGCSLGQPREGGGVRAGPGMARTRVGTNEQALAEPASVMGGLGSTRMGKQLWGEGGGRGMRMGIEG